MAHFCIKTRIENRTPKELLELFNEDLFRALKPPVMNLQVERFDGCQTNHEVHLKMDVFGLMNQKWISLITDHGESFEECFFVDDQLQYKTSLIFKIHSIRKTCMEKKQISFRYKLIASILIVSTIPLIVSAFYNLHHSTEALKHAAFEKLESAKESKNKSISRYLSSITNQIITLSHNKMLVDATNEFNIAFKAESNAPTKEELDTLNSYYD